MQTAVAANITRNTREQAETDANRDLANLREKAIDAGVTRSRRVFKTSLIDQRNGELRYNPAGRILRDWYLHVYLNTLRDNLGEPAVPIDAQQVEDTASYLRRVRPGIQPLTALRAVAVARDIAITDAAHATIDIVEPLGVVAAQRAIRHAADDRFDGDELSVHITRHWYQRCYDDTVHGATKTRQPFTEITAAEQHQVTLCLAAGEARRLISPTGVPLMTIHGTASTERDQRMAAGEPGMVSPFTDSQHHTDPEITLKERIERTWRELDDYSRQHWLQTAGSLTSSGNKSWEQLSATDQHAVTVLFLTTHQPDQVGVPFAAEPLFGEPRNTVTEMFAHMRPLDSAAGSAALSARETSLMPQETLGPARSRPSGPAIR